MASFNELFLDDYRYALNSISYKRHPVDSNLTDKQVPNLNILDALTVGQRSGSDVHVTFCRNVQFQPESNFSLAVEFDMVFEFQKSVDRDAVQDVEITQALQAAPFISEVISKASLLISQITLVGSLTPMVLPPSMIVDVVNQ